MAQGTTKGVPIDIDGTLSQNSDLLVASQKATKTYVDNGLLLKQNVIGYTPVNKGGDTMLGNLILNGNPTLPLQAATKDYIDTLINGIDWKQAANAATVSALPAYNVTGSGAILTGTSNGAIPSATTDGVTLVAGNRLLVKNETSTLTPNNGIYVVTQVGNGSTPFILTRSDDANTPSEISEATLSVSGGSTLSNTQWHCNPASVPVVIGTTYITFAQIGSGTYSAGSGLTLTGNVFSIPSNGVTDAMIQSSTNWNTAYTNRITSLTTTGNSGAATLSSNTLNIPNYTLSGLGGQPLNTNLTSLSGLTYSSTSFVKMTASGTFSLDTNTYLTSETDTLSSVTGRGATTGTAISITNSTATSSATTGALVVTGGIGVGGSVYIGTNLTTGGLTMGQGITNQNVYLTIQNPGIGYGNGFNFIRGTDSTGIRVIETGSDTTMYEMWMADNPDGGDMMQWRFDDWQNTNGMTVPIQTTGKSNRYVAETHTFYGTISQNSSAFYTTSNFGGTNGSDRQLTINTVGKLRTVGSTVNISVFNVSGYSGTDGNLFWIKLDTTTTFAWGYGSPSGTAVASGIALSTSEITLSNGIKVTFSATTGAVGDTFAARVFKAPSNTLGITTATSFVKSGGTSSQFLKADGSVDSNAYTTNLGTVTSVSALTIGTSGTDISSTVANGTTTPVITLNVPTASATNRGALSSADWSTFNSKESALTFTSPLSRATNTISIPAATGSVDGYLSSTDWTTFNNKQGALTLTTTGTSGAATLVGNTLNIPQYSGGSGMAIGGTVTSGTTGSVLFVGASSALSEDNANLFWDDTNNRLGIGTSAPGTTLTVRGDTVIEANGSTTTTPRGLGVAWSASTEAARWYFGDSLNSIQNSFGGRFIIQAYWGMSIYGGRINSTPRGFETGLTTDWSLNVFGTTAANPVSVVTGASGQSGNLQQWRNSSATTLLAVTSSGQLTSTVANSTTTGGGQIYLNGATGNRIDFNTNGVAAPAFTTRSAGTKIVLYPAIGASSVDYAIGIEGSTLWSSVDTTSSQFKWYAGTTNVLTLTGAGLMTLSRNQNAVTSLDISNTTSGTASQVYTQYISDASSGNVYFGKRSSATTTFSIIAPRDAFILNGVAGDIAIANTVATGTIKFAAGNSSTAQVTISSNGSLSVGTTSPSASSILQVDSTTQGFLPPRMTATQRAAITSPADGLIVYQTDGTSGLYIYNGSSWRTLAMV